jgi:hypothetical protein
MNLRGRLSTVVLTIWIAAAAVIYFRQFATPALLYISRTLGHH